MRRVLPLLVATLATLATPPAAAVDTWTTPYPGIRMLRRTTSQPVVMYALVIDTCAPGVRFRATSPREGTRTTSSFGRLVNAQMAINGDFADHDFGLNVGDGMRWSTPDTDHSGNFSVGPGRVEMTPDHVVLPAPAPWVTEQLGGRWTLLEDGVARRGIDDNGPPSGGFVCAPGLRHPRTAIGLSRDRGTVYILVADGRSSASIGMTCDEMINVFVELGAWNAMGLDGGGSSTLWRSTGLVNRPSDASGERTVRNHLAIFATGTGPAPHCGRVPTVTEPPAATSVAGAVLPTVTAASSPSRLRIVTPARLFDTRTTASSARLVRGDGSSAGPLSLASGGTFRAWSDVGVGADTAAAWLNVTAVGAPSPGFLTVWPEGGARPDTSNLNYAPTEALANAATVALGAGGGVRFDVTAAVDVVADLTGAFAPTGNGLAPVGPVRVLDTRTPAAPLRAGVAREVDVRAPAGATGVVATVTAVAREAAGFVTAHPCGAPTPPTSNLNFAPRAVVSNAVLSGLGSGRMCLTASTDVDVVVDVAGHLAPGAPLSYVALQPRRLLDTRGATTPWTGRVAVGQEIALPVQRLAGMPSGVGAVVANVTVVGASGDGYVTAWPCGAARPGTSALTFTADRAVGALTTTAVTNGSLCLASSARAHLVVDLQGVWTSAPPPPPPPPPQDAATPVDATAPADVAAPVDVAQDVPVAADVIARDVEALDAPRDVAVRPDVSVDVARPDDVALSHDATTDASDLDDRDLRGGCGCRASREGARPWALAAALTALLARRRRRARR